MANGDMDEIMPGVSLALRNTKIESSPDKLTDILVTTKVDINADNFNQSYDDIYYNISEGDTQVSNGSRREYYNTTTQFVYEVKTLSVKKGSLTLKRLIRGVEQLLDNPRVIAGGVPVLVADQNAVNAALERDVDLYNALLKLKRREVV